MGKAETDELDAARAAFCLVVARWRLPQAEVAALLGVAPGAAREGRVLPDELDAPGETRLRLLVRLDRGLAAIMDEDEIGRWLRSPAPAYDGRTPIEAFGDLADLRAVVRVLEGRREG